MRIASALAGILLLACALIVPPVQAAESYDGCTYEITALPAVLTSQGVWCLKGDLNTAITSGAAITISANNVTLDCNHAKVGGLSAGTATMAFGVHVLLRKSATIRHCNLRGFYYGVYIAGSTGTVVEENQFDGNTTAGISSNSASYGTIVRGNRISDTGGSTVTTVAGIFGTNDMHVIDNVVAGVAGDGVGNTSAMGIYVTDGSGTITGNRISGLANDGSGSAYGVYSGAGNGHAIDGNVVSGYGAAAVVVGVFCNGGIAVARNNVLMDVGLGVQTCEDVDNHVTLL